MVVDIPSVIFISTSLSIVYTANNLMQDEIFSDDIFEGDLKIPIEMILAYYNKSSIPKGNYIFQKMIERSKNKSKVGKINELFHAAVSSQRHLWPHGIVFYKISSTSSAKEIPKIQNAIHHWEENTCLQFLPAGKRRNYVNFVTREKSGCYTDYVGMKGVIQHINVPYLCGFGNTVHEIGHAIGFWHEHTRPDRDHYVNVNFGNIKKGKLRNFMTRSDISTDSYGTEYDFGSIMHYTPTSFAKSGCINTECITIAIKDFREYRRQGSPEVGQRRELSSRDKKQANRMYSCSGKGVSGVLLIKIKYGSSLNSKVFSSPDILVRLSALDSTGRQFFRRTQLVQYTSYPVWNEVLLYGYHAWQFFRISIWNARFEMTTPSITVPIEQNLTSFGNCGTKACGQSVIFEYLLDSRPHLLVTLKIYLRSARHLVKRDSWDLSDPYVRLDALQFDGVTKVAYSKTIFNTSSAAWNQSIDFDYQAWKFFYIQVFDEDISRDDTLSDRQMINLELGNHSYTYHICYGRGYLLYDYTVTCNDQL